MPRASLSLLLVALGLLAGPAGGQERTSAPGSVPTAVGDAVRALVAEAWEVAPECVVLHVDAVPEGWVPPEGATTELVGSGSGGWWVVRVTPAQDGQAVSLRLRAGVEREVRVAARVLPRNHAVDATDVALGAEVTWGRPDADDEAWPVGWQTQRVIQPGEPLRAPAVQPPLLVRSGEPVQVVWRRGEVGVRMEANAAGSARLGGTVLVRTASGKRLRGVVVGPGIVDVTRGGDEG